jgi:hypothetical protein
MHLSILLLLHPFESLQIYHEYGRALEYLKLLDSLLMHLTPTAKPCVLMGQLLRGHELPETVVNRHFIVLKQVERLSLSGLLREILRVFLESHHVLIEGPAFIGVERDLKLEFQVVDLLFLLWGRE